MIIDAHLHLPVVSEQRTYQQAKNLLLEDLKKDGVSFALLIPDNLPDSAIGDLPTCLQLVQDVSELFLLGTIEIQTQGAAWIQKLENLVNQDEIVGMKIFPGHDPIYPTDPRLDPLYELCQSNGIAMVIHTGWNSGHPEVAKYNDPKYIVQVSERYPELKIVIAHYFWPEVDYCFELTHANPNVYYDTSGLADNEVIEATGLERIQAVLLRTLEEKPDSLLFGSDYAMCNRLDHIRMIEGLPVPTDVREGVLWRNAVKVFNLPVQGIGI